MSVPRPLHTLDVTSNADPKRIDARLRSRLASGKVVCVGEDQRRAK